MLPEVDKSISTPGICSWKVVISRLLFNLTGTLKQWRSYKISVGNYGHVCQKCLSISNLNIGLVAIWIYTL